MAVKGRSETVRVAVVISERVIKNTVGQIVLVIGDRRDKTVHLTEELQRWLLLPARRDRMRHGSSFLTYQTCTFQSATRHRRIVPLCCRLSRIHLYAVEDLGSGMGHRPEVHTANYIIMRRWWLWVCLIGFAISLDLDEYVEDEERDPEMLFRSYSPNY